MYVEWNVWDRMPRVPHWNSVVKQPAEELASTFWKNDDQKFFQMTYYPTGFDVHKNNASMKFFINLIA